MQNFKAMIPLLALLQVACASTPMNASMDSANDSAVEASTTEVSSTDVALEDAAREDAFVPFLNDCNEADYEDHTAAGDPRSIVNRGNSDYQGRCSTIRVGQSVTFTMDFVMHPLVAGIPHGSRVGAAMPNVIQNQSTGTSYTQAFASAGYYPYYCGRHGHVGMAGVVRVLP